jgi:hypothetical protein
MKPPYKPQAKPPSKTIQTTAQQTTTIQAQPQAQNETQNEGQSLTLEDLNNFPLLLWEMDEEPNHPNHPNHPNNPPLLWLYTKMGYLLMGYWPENELLGNHYIAWAYPQYQHPLLAPGSIAIH